jgi:hypothetical protein
MSMTRRYTIACLLAALFLTGCPAQGADTEVCYGCYPFHGGSVSLLDETKLQGQADPRVHGILRGRPAYYRANVPDGAYEVTVHYLDAGKTNTGSFRTQCNGRDVAGRVGCYVPHKKTPVDTATSKAVHFSATAKQGRGLHIRFDYETRWQENHAVSAIEIVGEQATLRINCGAKSPYEDPAGRVWLPDRDTAVGQADIQLDPDRPTNQWVEIGDEMLTKMIRAGVEPYAKWKGRFTGRLNGIFYDRSGRVYVNFAALGLWVYEGPGGRMYRADNGTFLSVAKGWSRNPYGPGFVLFCSHGFGPKSQYQALSWDGKSIETWPKDADVGVVDWQATGEVKPIFSKPRHANGIEVTRDAGRSVQEIGQAKGIYNVGALGNGVWVYATGSWSDDPNQGVFRSDDMGKTWTQVLRGVNCKPTSNCAGILAYEDRAYLHTSKGLYKSSDRGKTWRLIPDSPVFEYTLQPAEDDRHMLGLSKDGVFETFDQGETWKKVLPPPPVQPDQMWIQSHGYYDFTWDHVNDVIYASAPDVAWRYARE